MSAPGLVVERVAVTLAGGRAQLVESVFVDGEQAEELTVHRGSPAPVEVVREREETKAWA